MHLSAVILLGLGLCLPLVAADEEHKEVSFKAITLSDLCANRQVPIISVKEVIRLIGELRSAPDTCPESYRQSFYELEPVLHLEARERLCGERKFKQIMEYHFRYINPKVETYKLGDDLHNLQHVIKSRPLHEEKFDYTVQLDDYKQEILIPISLQQFFKAWALQVSGLCKRAFHDNLAQAEQEHMTDTDFDIFETTKHAGQLILETRKRAKKEARAIAGSSAVGGRKSAAPADESSAGKSDRVITFNELVYMPEIEGEKKEGDLERRLTKKKIDLRDSPQMDLFFHACLHRFRPIYMELVMPVVRLAKLGYDYVGRKIDDIRDELESDPSVIRWKALTSICESNGPFEMVEREEEPIVMKDVVYTPKIGYAIEDNLWIKGAEALGRELNAINGYKSKGFQKFLFKSGIFGRKVVALLDPHQSAWYRRNQNTLSSTLNSLSIMSNAVSVGITLAGR